MFSQGLGINKRTWDLFNKATFVVTLRLYNVIISGQVSLLRLKLPLKIAGMLSSHLLLLVSKNINNKNRLTMHQKTPLISNRNAKQLAMGFASFRGFTCKSKNHGLVKVIFVCYQRLLKNVILKPMHSNMLSRVSMFGCTTSAQPICIVNIKAALWHPLQHTDKVHRLHGQDVEDLNTASC